MPRQKDHLQAKPSTIISAALPVPQTLPELLTHMTYAGVIRGLENKQTGKALKQNGLRTSDFGQTISA